MAIDRVIYSYVVNEEAYQDQDEIIAEGAKGNWAYLILEGKVKVKKKTAKGIVTIDTLKEGAIFGEMGLFAKGEAMRTASVVADGPVRVGLLDTHRIIKEYEALSPQMRALMRSVIKRLREATNKVTAMVVDLTSPNAADSNER